MHDHITLEIKFTQKIKKLLSKTYMIHQNLYFYIIFKFRVIITKYNDK